MTNGKVIGRVISEDELIQGDDNKDPLKNAIMYDVEYDDGTIKQYSANIIASNIIDQLCNNDYEPRSVKHIIDKKRDHSALKNN